MSELTVEKAMTFLREQGYLMGGIWSIDKVIDQAEDLDIKLNEEQAKGVLTLLENGYDDSIGINWGVVEIRIHEYLESELINRTFTVAIAGGQGIVTSTVTLKEIRATESKDDFEFLYALNDIKLLEEVPVNGMAYFQPDRDNVESKGILVRIK